ncbi:hypothetical protein AOQ84DRAFT_414279 [Glonium stellatum]|uniref:Uncharacterized protein n=1 Tax=Glonium stellatum TaxID=574774 RepID=A0A8E2FAT4_9PEZI|nr:hypothetical protein AOQ84DRAFT_414279 [Glonium stellatum]
MSKIFRGGVTRGVLSRNSRVCTLILSFLDYQQTPREEARASGIIEMPKNPKTAHPCLENLGDDGLKDFQHAGSIKNWLNVKKLLKATREAMILKHVARKLELFPAEIRTIIFKFAFSNSGAEHYSLREIDETSTINPFKVDIYLQLDRTHVLQSPSVIDARWLSEEHVGYLAQELLEVVYTTNTFYVMSNTLEAFLVFGCKEWQTPKIMPGNFLRRLVIDITRNWLEIQSGNSKKPVTKLMFDAEILFSLTQLRRVDFIIGAYKDESFYELSSQLRGVMPLVLTLRSRSVSVAIYTINDPTNTWTSTNRFDYACIDYIFEKKMPEASYHHRVMDLWHIAREAEKEYTHAINETRRARNKFAAYMFRDYRSTSTTNLNHTKLKQETGHHLSRRNEAKSKNARMLKGEAKPKNGAKLKDDMELTSRVGLTNDTRSSNETRTHGSGLSKTRSRNKRGAILRSARAPEKKRDC